MDPDIVMVNYEDGLPPIRPKYATKGSYHEATNFKVQAKIPRSRSSSPERRMATKLIPASQFSGSLRRESVDNPGSCSFYDEPSRDRQYHHFFEEKWSGERREEESRSKIGELDTFQYNSQPSKAFQELQDKLDKERGLREKAEYDSHQKGIEVEQLRKSLDVEEGRRENAQADLKQKSFEAEEIRKRWKQAARELDKLRSQSQGFYQVTDQYLIQLTTQLRYNTRSFAIQYFGGELRENANIKETGYWKDYMEPATRDTSAYDYLMSNGRCPSIIQAFLWRFLIVEIFDNFRWAGEASGPSWQLSSFLKPSEWSHMQST